MCLVPTMSRKQNHVMYVQGGHFSNQKESRLVINVQKVKLQETKEQEIETVVKVNVI